jgi:hypothetical protein
LRAAAATAENSGDVKRAKALMAEHDAILSQSSKPDASKQITRLLNKKTGKYQTYPGKLDPKDVDPNRFEIVK